jgi:hypothetical protein
MHCQQIPFDRYLQIDNKAWIGLEQTALSTDAKSHIGAVSVLPKYRNWIWSYVDDSHGF